MTDNKPESVTQDVVVSMAYQLTVDGNIEEAYDDANPIVFLFGHDNIISGLESAMLGMKVGDSKNVTVAPQDAYGEVVDEAIIEVSKNEFPENIPLVVGTILEVKDEQGNPMTAYITEVGDENITLDFNHPMAGKTLDFMIRIMDIRPGSPDEIKAGQVLSN